jgi:hypothetical protein
VCLAAYTRGAGNLPIAFNFKDFMKNEGIWRKNNLVAIFSPENGV